MTKSPATSPATGGERANFLVERRSIDFIPPHLRHGKPSDLMFVWFGANMELPVIAVGATTVAGGLGLGWAALAIVIGVAVGSLLMAYHSAQGPHLGLPQMIQSRAQFGYYGAAVPLVFVVAMYLGFYAAGAVLGGQALSKLTGLPLAASVIVLSVLSMVVATFGYNLIHKVEKYLSLFVAINLADYYFVRRGRYQVEDMFTPRGVYGRLSAAGAVAYVAGFVVQMPFMHNDVIQGPVARALHGGDVSWVVGAVVSGLIYLGMMRTRTTTHR